MSYLVLSQVALVVCACVGIAAVFVFALWAWIKALDYYARFRKLRRQWAYFCVAVQRIGLKQAEAVSRREIKLQEKLYTERQERAAIYMQFLKKHELVIDTLYMILRDGDDKSGILAQETLDKLSRWRW